ncbi:MAG: amidohydrolase [Gemmatimonadetes bacterium]|nr:amidohydrolase [Gemmatimonadota bacterium]NNM06515.1 amidohydrolase [Gemmatimonadota bacterium]
MSNQESAQGAPSLMDVHHHMVPPAYLEALKQAGLDTAGFPSWTPQESIEMMDRLGIEKASLSISSPGVWFGDDAEARDLARVCNEYAASVVDSYPRRFDALAVLPFPDVEGSVQELAYAMDTLGLAGVILFSNVGGRYAGDPDFDPLMAELHRRGAEVLLHPNTVPEKDENAPLFPWAEYPIDLARAYARLVYCDTLVKYPDIRWILSHAGGVVPFHAERLGKAYYAKDGGLRWGRILKDLALKRHRGLDLAKGLRYDTVGATNPVTLSSLQSLVGPDRILFGSNFPWDSEESVGSSISYRVGAKGRPPGKSSNLNGMGA